MPGPSIVRVAPVRYVRDGGTPERDAPAGTAAPMSRPFGPAPPANDPGRKLKSLRIEADVMVAKFVFTSSGSTRRFPGPVAKSVPDKMQRCTVRSVLPNVGSSTYTFSKLFAACQIILPSRNAPRPGV